MPSHVHAYSFEPKGDWSYRFSPGAEIQGYFEGLAQKYGLAPHFRFDSEIECAEFRGGRWHLSATDGTTELRPLPR